MGQRLVADYVLTTRIKNLGDFVETTHFLDTTRTLHRDYGRVAVSFRLIDPVTAEVVDAATVRATLSGAQLRRYGPTGSARQIGATLATYVGENITKAITNALYPVMIIDATGNRVVIAQGSYALRAGESYRVYRYGKALTDPYTGASLGREDHFCCVVHITRTEPDLAYGKMVALKTTFQHLYRPETFIIRGRIEQQRELRSSRANRLRRMIRHQDRVFGSSAGPNK